ncbi:MAG: four helix bundle protein [Bacteroidota bacterium]|jgi:four helix bundle protein
MHKYEELKVYQKGLTYSKNVRTGTKQFPKEELYALTSQFRRAADSIVLNIAEGAGNYSDKEFARFLTYSIRSGFECKGCIDVALINEYLNEEQGRLLKNDVNEIIAMLDGLYKKVNK